MQEYSIRSVTGALPMPNKLPKATHQGDIKIPGLPPIPCANLDNGMRVLSERGFLEAIDRSAKAPGNRDKSGADKLPPFLAADNLKAFVDNHLTVPTNPVSFTPVGGGKPAFGYLAELLPEVCLIYSDALISGAVRLNQRHVAERCQRLGLAFMKIGIVAYIDEATGYQEKRPKNALEAMLEMYLLSEPAKWEKKFSYEFYKEIHRLKGWNWDSKKHTMLPTVGKIVVDVVYKRIQPDIWEEMLKKNPKDEKGRRKYKYHQFLTENIGNPHLKFHLQGVIKLMKGSSTWSKFMFALDRYYPICNQVQMDIFFDLMSPEDFDYWKDLVS
jgi:hypothetical protein